ncbi:hypothetical protein ACFXGA_00875 [Actinosynnema sp. NPDC059335]|uniref:hypothetical protein n=1 Tax=Actinosynnema sp. NPDC059335 TaxID=3346804 RepID=UPI0036709912
MAASSLARFLMDMPRALRHGSTMHMFHADAAERCKSLAITLESAGILGERDAYGPACALLRSALEQTLVDKLVFSGRRYVQIVTGVTEDMWQTWEQERAAGTKWQDVTDWTRNRNGRVRIVREGLLTEPAEDGSRQAISVHYLLLQDFTPFVASPAVHEHEDDGLSDPEQRRTYAEQNRSMYEEYLRWQSLKESFKANVFADDAVVAKLDVHYRFLSAFVHPISDVTRLLYGKDASMGWPMYDHYSSELVLLYIIVLAVIELRNFCEMTLQKPSVEIDGRDGIEQACSAAWELSNYLWFPGQSPHAHDRYEEANRRAWAAYRETKQLQPPGDPVSLSTDEIRYYQNPLRRLIALHSSKQEMTTGLSYVSPWPRTDARLGR